MTDPPRYPGTSTGNTSTGSTSDDTSITPPGRKHPRWVTAAVIAIIAAILLLMIILHITGTVGPGTG